MGLRTSPTSSAAPLPQRCPDLAHVPNTTEGHASTPMPTGFLLTVLPIILQSSCFEVHAVDLSKDLVHGSVDGPALAGLQPGEGGVLVDVAGAVLHQVEWRANDAGRQGKQRPFSDCPLGLSVLRGGIRAGARSEALGCL